MARRVAFGAADLDRLCGATGRSRIDPNASLFPPDSVTWRINGEAALLLGGGRALLMQIAHPLVAAGVSAHSNFRADPLGRVWRTLDLMLTISFADAVQAMRAVRQIERVHARVHGVLASSVGPFPAGTAYNAADPELLLWVHATLVDTAVLAYERFVAPLSRRQRETYYEESKVGARLFGIPEVLIPPQWSNFRCYMRAMIVGDRLSVGQTGREIARSILNPPLPLGMRQALQATNLVTIGLLPPKLRRSYGLSWGPGRDAILHALAATPRRLLPFVPRFIRTLPHARRALRASAGAQAAARQSSG